TYVRRRDAGNNLTPRASLCGSQSRRRKRGHSQVRPAELLPATSGPANRRGRARRPARRSRTIRGYAARPARAGCLLPAVATFSNLPVTPSVPVRTQELQRLLRERFTRSRVQ